MLVEDAVNNPRADIHLRLDGLIECYEEVVKDSALSDSPVLNYWAREYLRDLRHHRREIRDKKLLETLFQAFDEKLFRLGLEHYGKDFVEVSYAPTILI